KKSTPKQYQTSFKVDLKKIDPISELLNVNLKVTPGTSIQGNFNSGYTTIFRAFTFADTVNYNGNVFLSSEAEITASKIADSTSVLAMAFINSEQQNLKSGLKTQDLLVEGIWNRNHIDFGVDCREQVKDNYVRLRGATDFMKDSTVIKL